MGRVATQPISMLLAFVLAVLTLWGHVQLWQILAVAGLQGKLYAAHGWWAVQGSNLRPPACKAGALTN